MISYLDDNEDDHDDDHDGDDDDQDDDGEKGEKDNNPSDVAAFQLCFVFCRQIYRNQVQVL